QSFFDNVSQKIFGANLRELFCEANNDRLFDAEDAKAFNLLIQSLQQGRGRFRVKYFARMWMESDHGRHGANCASSFGNSSNDQLMTKVQAIKHAERQHRRAGNVGVICTMKETHSVSQSVTS